MVAYLGFDILKIESNCENITELEIGVGNGIEERYNFMFNLKIFNCMCCTIENSKNAGGAIAGSGSSNLISENQSHALFVAAYMLTDIVAGDEQRRRFLMDVCLSFTASVLNGHSNAGVKYVPENDWAKDWARHTGILSPDDVPPSEMDDYIDDLEDLKPTPECTVLQAKAELRQAEEQLEKTKQEIVDLIDQIHIIGR
ncbi:MAG: hypothetical protein LUC91_07490 [Prevotella sp.]|nr:hypothetical protein [Prevotella sp.]